MKLPKLLAVLVLAAGLSACEKCEDVNLGKLEFTNELVSFLPAQPTSVASYYATTESGKLQLKYEMPAKNATLVIPAGKNNYTGKFDPNSCKNYYTSEEKVFTSQITGEKHFSIKTKYRKDADPDRYNAIHDKEEVNDVVEFEVGYANIYPEPVPYGTTTITNFTSRRTFILSDAATTTLDGITYKQEFLPEVTVGGVTHKNVYHLYLKQPYLEAHEPRSEKYPIDFVQGIYISEGVGIIHAYTFRGKNLSITVE
ncbi:hypothetical protein [Pontibacter arcticus]|uniref:DUF4249 domain-containing protein n=1 Tax=Pontibacter arcticus TaxID=2080288 RepID=A0A364RIX0_9BACT|nr:hypothetical protein [Pontibacter arcticus]RAU84249.1 hypothetical protein DP923_04180 [Pontibacter arcticus]